MITQYMSHRLPDDGGYDAHRSPPEELLLAAEDLIAGAAGESNRLVAIAAADQSWQKQVGAHGNSHIWHRPSRTYGTSAHEPPWLPTVGSSNDPSPATGYGNAPQQTQPQQQHRPHGQQRR